MIDYTDNLQNTPILAIKGVTKTFPGVTALADAAFFEQKNSGLI